MNIPVTHSILYEKELLYTIRSFKKRSHTDTSHKIIKSINLQYSNVPSGMGLFTIKGRRRCSNSSFAISKGLLENSQGDPADPFANIDESKLEQLMSEMAPGMQDDGDQEDPKQMAHLMKRMFELTGGEPTGAMLEAIKRMEAGEDPDAIDEELGPAIDEQPDPFSSAGSAPTSKSTASKRLAVRRLLQAPKVDPELYELEQ
jgi:hypothetical protein